MSSSIRTQLGREFVMDLQRMRLSWPALRLLVALLTYIDQFGHWPNQKMRDVVPIRAETADIKRAARLSSSGNNRALRAAIAEILPLGIVNHLEIHQHSLVWQPSLNHLDLRLDQACRFCPFDALTALDLDSSAAFFVHVLVEGSRRADLPMFELVFPVGGRVWERARPKVRHALAREAKRVGATAVILVEHPIELNDDPWMEVSVRMKLPKSKWFEGAFTNRVHLSTVTGELRFASAYRLDLATGDLIKVQHPLYDRPALRSAGGEPSCAGRERERQGGNV